MSSLASRFRVLAAAALLVVGCKDTDPSGPPPFEPHDETGDDDDTGDDDTTEEQAELVSLTILPAAYVIDSETSYPLTAIAAWDDGTHARVDSASFEVQDPAVAEVSTEGLVSGVAVGETTITGTYLGVVSDPVDVTVEVPGTMHVRVVDADTGAPLEGAELFIGDSAALDAYGVTNAAGAAVLTGAFSGPETITVKLGNYYRTSICGVTTRELLLPVRHKFPPEDGTLVGTATWLDEPDAFQIQLGLASAAIHDNPVFIDVSRLMGTPREVEVYGYDMELPANVVIGDVALDFEAPGPAGPTAAYALTGVFEVEAILEAFAEDAEVTAMLKMLSEGMREVDYALETGLQMPDAGVVDVGTLVPFAPVGIEKAVVVPPLPLGFAADDDPAVFTMADLGAEGMVLVGLGIGQGGIVVQEVNRDGPLDSVDSRYVAVVEVDGIGIGNPRSAVISDRVAQGGEVLFPEFLDLTVMTAPEEMDFDWTYDGDEDTDLFFIELEGSAATHHVWARGDTDLFELDDIEPFIGLGNADWHMTAMGLRDTCYESLIHDAAPDLAAAGEYTNRQSHNRIHYFIPF